MSHSSISGEEITSELGKRQKTFDFNTSIRSFDFTPIDPDNSISFSGSKWNELCVWSRNVTEYLEFQQIQMNSFHQTLITLQTQLHTSSPSTTIPTISSTQPTPTSSFPMNNHQHPPPPSFHPPQLPTMETMTPPFSLETPFTTVLPKKKPHRRSTTYAQATALNTKKPAANPSIPSTVPPATSSTPFSPTPAATNSSFYQPPKLHHRTQLKSIQSTEEKLQLLLRKVTPPVESVASIYFHAHLSRQALKDPIHSIKTLFQTLTDIPALGISLISPHQFEVFLPADSIPSVQNRLQTFSSKFDPKMEFNHIPNPDILTEKDVKRRAATYNRSHFPLLRRACLTQFPTHLQLQVLAHAKSCLPHLPSDRQKSLTKALQEDEAWIQQNSVEMTQQV